MVKISIELPDEWNKILRQAALDADCKSVSEYLRRLIEQSPDVVAILSKTDVRELPELSRSWGGTREQVLSTDRQVPQVPQDAQLDQPPHLEQVPQDADNATIEAPKPAKAEKPAKSGMAQPKGDGKVPEGYGRKSAIPPAPKIPPVVGARTNSRHEDVD